MHPDKKRRINSLPSKKVLELIGKIGTEESEIDKTTLDLLLARTKQLAKKAQENPEQ